ncbi:hypothetical protein BofuT4_P093430.1 [Botrytis cinerea T4]|uniref:Uncharacterized protein n=1 Tax=Botryotinia fuckeliana (strain T4) TaxID=999810 RepID=G2YE73_BOTF4|nr:hypothetical protein BofuT4_P093430.1 [Botrytis cinerea T4]
MEIHIISMGRPMSYSAHDLPNISYSAVQINLTYYSIYTLACFFLSLPAFQPLCFLSYTPTVILSFALPNFEKLTCPVVYLVPPSTLPQAFTPGETLSKKLEQADIALLQPAAFFLCSSHHPVNIIETLILNFAHETHPTILHILYLESSHPI